MKEGQKVIDLKKENSVNKLWNICAINMPSTRRRGLKCCHEKSKSYMNKIQKHHCLLQDRAHLKWIEERWKTVLWSDESKFKLLFGKHPVLWTKKETNHPNFFKMHWCHQIQNKRICFSESGTFPHFQLLICFASFISWLKYTFVRFSNHCVLTFHTASPHFWNWGCRFTANERNFQCITVHKSLVANATVTKMKG